MDAEDFFENMTKDFMQLAKLKKEVELVTTTAHYVNEMRAFTCNPPKSRKTRGLDSLGITLFDVGLKKYERVFIEARLMEIEGILEGPHDDDAEYEGKLSSFIISN